MVARKQLGGAEAGGRVDVVGACGGGYYRNESSAKGCEQWSEAEDNM